MKKTITKRKDIRGGPRPNSARSPKPDPDLYSKVTVRLCRSTIEHLRRVGGDYFGEFLQSHLDRYPLPMSPYPPVPDRYEAQQHALFEKARKARPMTRVDKTYFQNLKRKLIAEARLREKQHGNGTRKADKGQPVAH
jgi:hypothetical protein